MELLALFLLFTKHFIVDFPLQDEYQWKNKGTYGHLGGVLHSSLHAAATGIVFSFLTTPEVAAIAAVIDGFVHYHIDWAKININKRYGWQAHTSEKFWWLLGLDQYLHALTYIALVGHLL